MKRGLLFGALAFAALAGCSLFSPLGYLTSEGPLADGGGDGTVDPQEEGGPLPPSNDLATGQELPGGIVLDATTIFWANGGSHKIRSMPKGGGAPIDVVTTTDNKLEYLAVDPDPAGYVYWSNGKTISRALKAGGAPEPIYDAVFEIDGFVVDDTMIYVNETNESEATAVLARAPKGTKAREIITADDDPDGLAVDAVNLIWTDFNTSALKTMPKGGKIDGGVTSIGDDNDQIDPGTQSTFAIDDDAVYFSESGDTTLWRHQRNAAAKRQQLLVADNEVKALIIDAAHLYYLDSANIITRVDKQTGQNKSTLAKPSFPIGGLVTDGTSVYFTVQGVAANDGIIRRVPVQ